MRNTPLENTFVLLAFFVGALACGLPQPTPLPREGAVTPAPKPAAAAGRNTLRCTAPKLADNPVVEVSWTADAEDADGEGRFELTASTEKVTDKPSVAVTSYVPKYDPETDIVHYRVGWASKDFRTTLRLFEREKAPMGDFDSRAFSANDLSCDNNLPIRGAIITFTSDAWNNVSTALALLTCIKFKRADAIVSDEIITLPVRFVSKTDIAKCEAQLVAVERTKFLYLTRADGTAVPKKKDADKPKDDQPSKKIGPKKPEG